MYGKLFSQMYDGTLATKGPWQALVTFQQLIILANKNGEVDMTPEAISRRTTIPLEIIQNGIERLMQDDPDSRSPDENGRRIVPLSEHRAWGWRIVNYDHYRKIRSEEERREYHRNYMREKRSVKQNVKVSTSGDQCQPIAVSSKQNAVSNEKALSGKPDASLQKEEKQQRKAQAIEILQFLNERAGKAFRPVDTNLDFIAGRLKDGMTPLQARQIILRKQSEWAGTEMEQYLRPATLFNKTNCEQYLGELVAK